MYCVFSAFCACIVCVLCVCLLGWRSGQPQRLHQHEHEHEHANYWTQATIITNTDWLTDWRFNCSNSLLLHCSTWVQARVLSVCVNLRESVRPVCAFVSTSNRSRSRIRSYYKVIKMLPLMVVSSAWLYSVVYRVALCLFCFCLIERQISLLLLVLAFFSIWFNLLCFSCWMCAGVCDAISLSLVLCLACGEQDSALLLRHQP